MKNDEGVSEEMRNQVVYSNLNNSQVGLLSRKMMRK
jgi:hypothetical protein